MASIMMIDAVRKPQSFEINGELLECRAVITSHIQRIYNLHQFPDTEIVFSHLIKSNIATGECCL